MSGLSTPVQVGTWTPLLRFNGATTGIAQTQSGRWRRAPDGSVRLQGRIVLTSKGSATGPATIAGVPFPALALPVGLCVPFLSNVSGIVMPVAYVTPSASTIEFFENFSGTAHTNTNFTDTSVINLDIEYRS